MADATAKPECPADLEDLRPLRPEEVAGALGISKRTVYRLVREGQIPGAFQAGRLIRFRRAEVLAWLGHGGPASGNE